jgi:methyl coenzyme M reductase subunit C-like uncharacterized protein (methanogenesis marker protein 7)
MLGRRHAFRQYEIAVDAHPVPLAAGGAAAPLAGVSRVMVAATRSAHGLPTDRCDICERARGDR